MSALLLAAALALSAVPPTAPPDVPPLRSASEVSAMTGASVIERYADALAHRHAPRIVSFEYALEQTGAHALDQTHRVFRSGDDQRDEILTVDGKRLDPPSIRIFRGRRDRYAVESLAPQPAAYAFKYLGTARDAHHVDYLFATTPREEGSFVVTRVTIDGLTYLPASISFTTAAHHGSGTITYSRAGDYWVPVAASARARYENLAASERIIFSHYRFPASLPPSTFDLPRPLPTPIPPALSMR